MASVTTSTQPRWHLGETTVIGSADGHVWRARGIRYADAGRYETPRPVPLPDNKIDARQAGPACPQVRFALFDEVLDAIGSEAGYDEDCLRLSITVPEGTAPDAKLPVLVWIHGGSYLTGGGDLPVYDPSALVTEQQVVVVTVTYRLGLFGYLSRPGVPGNLGLLDQREALRWVQRHIPAFGGDPANVTAFGESAGGDSVANLMIAEGAHGLMRRAIVMSAPLGLMPGRDRMYSAMAQQLTDLDSDAAVDEILERTKALERMSIRYGLRAGMPFGPQFGLDPLPPEDSLDDAWSAVAPNIDLLIGWTHREAALFVPGPLGRVDLRPRVREALVGRLTRRIYSDPAARFAQRHAEAGGRGGTYVVTSGRGLDHPLVGSHTTDLPLLFPGPAWDAIAGVSGVAWSVTEEQGRQLRTVIGDFARDGSLEARDDDPVTVQPL
ncbi:carboxylesterase family protein [Yimella sp. cx-51]|uniref:carboxylesterase family protein n=1 Tax=Yimella sp. cx-51 TaxID=2770551 RepID=UPI00165E6BA0|nr:carboxylesterase family protein [Yimella sp. cx-51]MBC9955679.1 carboxylesterase family protein [Yimella sp. cx-51]